MKRARKRGEKGIALLFFAAIAVAFIPMVGLAIDASVLYVVKARISAACDAASLAAARNLSVGQTMTAQVESAINRAQSFFDANLPNNFMGATHGPATINIPTNNPDNTLTVTTTGTADVRTYFMRMLGVNHVTVAATGTASRRDVNMMMVLDRSASMNTPAGPPTPCAAMRTAAVNFVNRFVDGRDKIGLVHFGTTVNVAFPPANNFKSGSTNIPNLINNISCSDRTMMSSAYWEAYKRLVQLGQPGALNVILLFTDGVPNGFHGRFTIRTAADQRFGYSGGPTGCTSTSTLCNMPVSPCSTAGTVDGVLGAVGDLALTGATDGLYRLAPQSVTSYAAQQVTRAGCAFQGSGNQSRIRRDLQYIPDQDLDGNLTKGGTQPYYTMVSSGQNTDYAPGFPSFIRLDRPATITKVSSNVIDHAARRVRNRELHSDIGVVTYAIGFGNVDHTLLRRIANDPASNIYYNDPDTPDGKFIYANNVSEMNDAFYRIASEVLRLSR